MEKPQFPNTYLSVESRAFALEVVRRILLQVCVGLLVVAAVAGWIGGRGTDYAIIVSVLAALMAVGVFASNRKHGQAVKEANEQIHNPIDRESAVQLSRYLGDHPEYKELAQELLDESGKSDLITLSTLEIRSLRQRIKKYDDDKAIQEAQGMLSKPE